MKLGSPGDISHLPIRHFFSNSITFQFRISHLSCLLIPDPLLQYCLLTIYQILVTLGLLDTSSINGRIQHIFVSLIQWKFNLLFLVSFLKLLCSSSSSSSRQPHLLKFPRNNYWTMSQSQTMLSLFLDIEYHPVKAQILSRGISLENF